jgi:hypothetical protein
VDHSLGKSGHGEQYRLGLSGEELSITEMIP